MPKAFLDCIKEHGRVRTVKPKANKYLPVCFKGGKSYAGEVHTNKPKRRREIGVKE